MTFGEKVMAFYSKLDYTGQLPAGVGIMNPYKDNPDVLNTTRAFYSKYFNDNRNRILILGINPGRFGAGTTGLPFTDTLRLNEKCGIAFDTFRTYEPSSAFIYEMIEAYGGVRDFFGKFFISAVCPLGFTITGANGKKVNYNYYDNRELTESVYDFIVTTLKHQIGFGIRTDVCFCLGTGKNDLFLRKLNEKHRFFQSISTLEHPRYIMQYKSRTKDHYISKYVNAFLQYSDL